MPHRSCKHKNITSSSAPKKVFSIFITPTNTQLHSLHRIKKKKPHPSLQTLNACPLLIHTEQCSQGAQLVIKKNKHTSDYEVNYITFIPYEMEIPAIEGNLGTFQKKKKNVYHVYSPKYTCINQNWSHLRTVFSSSLL